MAPKHILHDEIPADLNAVSDRLQQLSDALSSKRDRKGLSRTEDRDWSKMLDYWHHVETLQGVVRNDDYAHPATDPLTLLDVAEKFNLAAPEKIETLRQQFTRKAAAIVGQELTTKQVRDLYKLMNGFNPAKPR